MRVEMLPTGKNLLDTNVIQVIMAAFLSVSWNNYKYPGPLLDRL